MRDPGSEVGNYPVNYLMTPLKFPGNVRRPPFFWQVFKTGELCHSMTITNSPIVAYPIKMQDLH